MEGVWEFVEILVALTESEGSCELCTVVGVAEDPDFDVCTVGDVIVSVGDAVPLVVDGAVDSEGVKDDEEDGIGAAKTVDEISAVREIAEVEDVIVGVSGSVDEVILLEEDDAMMLVENADEDDEDDDVVGVEVADAVESPDADGSALVDGGGTTEDDDPKDADEESPDGSDGAEVEVSDELEISDADVVNDRDAVAEDVDVEAIDRDSSDVVG